MVDPVAIEEMILQIQCFVYPRRIRCKEFFKDYDPLRTSTVTMTQFLRAIDLSGVRLSPAQAQTLASGFTLENGDVNYGAFCDRVDAVFATKNLEKSPTAKVPRAGESIPALFTPQEVEETNRDMLTNILHRAALLSETRGVVLKYCYQDFDRSNCGSVTKAQFRQNFPFLQKNGLNEQDLELLVDRYTDARGTVNYRALHEDITKAQEAPDATKCPRSDLIVRPDLNSRWTQEDLIAEDKIQAKVVEKRVRMRDYFQDFDHLRKGFCTCGQVRTVMAILNLEVSEEDMQSLFERYTREDGLFHYAGLTAKIDSAFTQVGLENDPMARISMTDENTTMPARRNKIKSDAEEQAMVDQIEEKIRARTRERRLHLVSFFQDFDRSRRGHVSKGQFARVMATMAFELSEAQVTRLCRRYCDLGNHVEFNYLDFCANCDPPSESEKVAMQQTMAAYEPQKASKYFDDRGRVFPLKVN